MGQGKGGKEEHLLGKGKRSSLPVEAVREGRKKPARVFSTFTTKLFTEALSSFSRVFSRVFLEYFKLLQPSYLLKLSICRPLYSIFNRMLYLVLFSALNQ